MRSRALAVLVAAVAVQAAGCDRWCRCCGSRADPHDRIPPPALSSPPLPPPASPSVSAAPAAGSSKPTGAYGGSGE